MRHATGACVVVVLFVVVAFGSAITVRAQSQIEDPPEIDNRHVEMCLAKTLDYLERVRDAATELQEFKIRHPDRVNEYATRLRALNRSINLTAQSFAVRQKLAMLVVVAAIKGEEGMTIEKARTILGCVLG